MNTCKIFRSSPSITCRVGERIHMFTVPRRHLICYPMMKCTLSFFRSCTHFFFSLFSSLWFFPPFTVPFSYVRWVTISILQMQFNVTWTMEGGCILILVSRRIFIYFERTSDRDWNVKKIRDFPLLLFYSTNLTVRFFMET